MGKAYKYIQELWDLQNFTKVFVIRVPLYQHLRCVVFIKYAKWVAIYPKTFVAVILSLTRTWENLCCGVELLIYNKLTQWPICEKKHWGGGGGSPTGKRVEAPQALTCNTNTGVRIDPPPPGAQIDGDSGGQKIIRRVEPPNLPTPGKSDPELTAVVNLSDRERIYMPILIDVYVTVT